MKAELKPWVLWDRWKLAQWEWGCVAEWSICEFNMCICAVCLSEQKISNCSSTCHQRLFPIPHVCVSPVVPLKAIIMSLEVCKVQVMTTGLEICLRLSAVPCRSSMQAQSCVRNNFVMWEVYQGTSVLKQMFLGKVCVQVHHESTSLQMMYSVMFLNMMLAKSCSCLFISLQILRKCSKMLFCCALYFF